ncbi:MAG TPA: hypothetical protein VGE29_19190 [Prosthecobacter sp.]
MIPRLRLLSCVSAISSALILTVAVTGCIGPREQLQPVWLGEREPPASLAAPAGFAVSPAQAFETVRQSRIISLKHVWHVYADSRCYYVHDAFLGTSAGHAKNQGVRVDGQTGQILEQQPAFR